MQSLGMNDCPPPRRHALMVSHQPAWRCICPAGQHVSLHTRDTLASRVPPCACIITLVSCSTTEFYAQPLFYIQFLACFFIEMLLICC